MADLLKWFQTLSTEKRAGLALAVSAIVLFAALAIWWVVREEFEILFSGLSAEDASAVTRQLDVMNVSSKVDGRGNVFVPKDMVHRARIGVMSEVPEFKGPIGYEIFDRSDFGVTELTQRINFQRALEGELARSIAGLSEVKKARVHLAVPQHGLFRQESEKPTASVIVFLRSGAGLNAKQVGGIQRLVASAVAQLEPARVTVLDQSGSTLAGPQRDGGDPRSNFGEKEAIESYMAHKAEMVIRAAQPEATIAVSVDATINLDRIKRVRETVGNGEGSAVIRRRDVSGGGDEKGGTATVETEYVVGKQMEEVISSPGVIQRLSVAVSIGGGRAVDEGRLRELVASAIGLDQVRGDKVALYAEPGYAPVDAEQAGDVPDMALNRTPVLMGMGLLLVIASVAILVLTQRLRGARIANEEKRMSATEREIALQRIKGWLSSDGMLEGRVE